MNTNVEFINVKFAGEDRSEQLYELTFTNDVVVEIDMDIVEDEDDACGQIEFGINGYEDGITENELDKAVNALYECYEEHRPSTLREIAEENGLELVTTTKGANGYPSQLNEAIVGFDTFEQVEKIAEEHNLEIIELHRRDGWQLWEVMGHTFSAFDMIENYEDYHFDNKEEALDFIEECRKEAEQNLANGEIGEHEFDRLTRSYQDSINYINDAWEEGRYIIGPEATDLEVIDRYVTSYYHDTHLYVIGVRK